MSRQLALSATFSVFAMSAFALSQGPAGMALEAPTQTGATFEAAAPVLPHAPELPALRLLND